MCDVFLILYNLLLLFVVFLIVLMLYLIVFVFVFVIVKNGCVNNLLIYVKGVNVNIFEKFFNNSLFGVFLC